jgi:hypothetical protein
VGTYMVLITLFGRADTKWMGFKVKGLGQMTKPLLITTGSSLKTTTILWSDYQYLCISQRIMLKINQAKYNVSINGSDSVNIIIIL